MLLMSALEGGASEEGAARQDDEAGIWASDDGADTARTART
jgi:hypothetical protein